MEDIFEKYQKMHYDEHSNMAENMSSKNGEGGAIRGKRGELVELIIENLWKDINPNNFSNKEKFKIKSVCGNYTIKKALDRNLYKDNQLVAMVECKSYLDEGMLQRAISDSEELNEYNVPKIVVALENSMKDETFCYWLSKNKLQNVFFLVDGKRSSSKPLYEKKYLKNLNKAEFIKMYNWMLSL
jgi:hypothetical protein